MSSGNIDKLYKNKVKPVKGEEDALYFIGDNTSDYIDFYVTDKQGNLIPIIDSNRFSGGAGTGATPTIEITQYLSDIQNTDYYYYGYSYDNSTIKIVRVEKGNVVNRQKAINLIGSFMGNWNNRQILIYN